MKYGLTQTAKAAGKSKSSIYRAIKNGVISASRGNDSQFQIDPADTCIGCFPPCQETIQKRFMTRLMKRA